MRDHVLRNRRTFLQSTALGATMFSVPGLFAEELIKTPSVGEGPFYPDKMPLDTDNDLLLINDTINPAVGEITHLTGRVLSAAGIPIRNAFVEIWQVDSKGSYIHTHGSGDDGRDKNFQGYGRFLTDSKGQYYFRTIKPVAYGVGRISRTPHIHVGVSKNGQRICTTQMFIKGEPANDRDGLFRNVRDPKARETILVDFKPIKDSKIGELAANFDIVLGTTVEELEDGTLKGGIGKPQSQGNRRRRG